MNMGVLSESWNPGGVWIARELKAHLVPMGRDTFH